MSPRRFVCPDIARHDCLRGKLVALPIGAEADQYRSGEFHLDSNRLRRPCSLVIVKMRGGAPRGAGNWPSAVALFVYAAGFLFAYVSLPAATGALLLFGAVQATMIGYGFWRGERLRGRQVAGLIFAFGGLIGLLLPGLTAPPLQGAILMLGAGAAWGIYSLRGKDAGDPTSVTAGNFLRAVPLAAGLSAAMLPWASPDRAVFGYAMVSGALRRASDTPSGTGPCPG